MLTPRGLQKLRDAIANLEDEENFAQKLTLAELSIRTRLTADTVAKVLDAEQAVDRRTLDSFFRALHLQLSESDFCRADLRQAQHPPQSLPKQSANVLVQIDWGEAVATSSFYGRTQELETLTQWVQTDRCQLITVLGMGGIGKSSLVAKLIDQLAKSNSSPTAPSFQYVIWRSLSHAPTVEETLIGLIHTLSNQPDIDLPKALHPLISQLMQYLIQMRCLLVLDNTETILQAGEQAGSYREGFEGYRDLIRKIGQSPHQSCVILTGRELPRQMNLLENKPYPTRTLLLKGLQLQDGLQLLQSQAIDGTEADHHTLFHHYAGNPLTLKIAAATIQLLFLGNLARFLAEGITVFGAIYELLDHQFKRLSHLEKNIIHQLALHREPMPLPHLTQAITPPISPQTLLETLENLGWRSLIECSPTGFTLQPLLMEYATIQLIKQPNDQPPIE